MEFPLNFFQQRCTLFSCTLSKGASPVSSLNMQIHVHLEKYTGESHNFCWLWAAASQVLLTLKCKVLAGAAILIHRHTPQERSCEWKQNKTVSSAKFLFHLGSGRIVRKSPDWSPFQPLEKLVKSQQKNAVVNSPVMLSSACGHRIHQLSKQVNKGQILQTLPI